MMTNVSYGEKLNSLGAHAERSGAQTSNVILSVAFP